MGGQNRTNAVASVTRQTTRQASSSNRHRITRPRLSHSVGALSFQLNKRATTVACKHALQGSSLAWCHTVRDLHTLVMELVRVTISVLS